MKRLLRLGVWCLSIVSPSLSCVDLNSSYCSIVIANDSSACDDQFCRGCRDADECDASCGTCDDDGSGEAYWYQSACADYDAQACLNLIGALGAKEACDGAFCDTCPNAGLCDVSCGLCDDDDDSPNYNSDPHTMPTAIGVYCLLIFALSVAIVMVVRRYPRVEQTDASAANGEAEAPPKSIELARRAPPRQPSV